MPRRVKHFPVENVAQVAVETKRKHGTSPRLTDVPEASGKSDDGFNRKLRDNVTEKVGIYLH